MALPTVPIQPTAASGVSDSRIAASWRMKKRTLTMAKKAAAIARRASQKREQMEEEDGSAVGAPAETESLRGQR